MTEHARVVAMIERQREAYRASSIPCTAARRDRLDRMKKLLARNADALAAAMDADFGGRDATFSKMNDVLACIMSLDMARRKLNQWAKPSSRSAGMPFSLFGAKAEVTYSPKGVIGIIGSWNAPLYTLMAPLSSAIAAGNRAILKPSELAPATGSLLEQLIAGEFDAADLAVVNGDATTAEALVAGAVDMIVFTGGAATGRKVMEAAARRLTPVILELGGKSPVIISRSADIEQAAQRIALGKGANSGQLCISPDTIHVPREKVKAFCDALLTSYRRHFGATGATAALINEHHLNRVHRMLADAQPHSRAVVGLPAEPNFARRLAFTLVIDPAPEALISQEEIFGPAAVVRAYDEIDTLITDLRCNDKPLALYYFGVDKVEERKVLDSLPSGGATINDVLMHASSFDAPFGGAGLSGMGSFHGREGFEAMSHVRTIFHAGWWDPRKALDLLPPYSNRMRNMIDAAIARAAR